MALLTSQQIGHYFQQYAAIDVTFTKEVVKALSLRAKQTFLRCLGFQLPCIIYSSSMTGAKIIASLKADLREKLREANNLVSLRFCFDRPDKQDPIAFYVSAKVLAFSPYHASQPGLDFLTLKFTQRPSDDLIAILGTLLEANINAKRRKEERIDVNPDTMRRLGIRTKEATLYVDEVPRKCILRDLSFSGASVLVTGVAKFLVDRPVRLRIEIDQETVTLVLTGAIARFDPIPDRKEIGAAGIRFHDNSVPMDYKMRINEFITSVRKPG